MIDWRIIDKMVERHNCYHDRKRKLRELREYYRRLKYQKQ